jgi:HEXXH motif-containing protein
MTSYHTLSPAELDAIASGEPDAPVIETLLSGQYSKRLVMIRAILTVAADCCPDAHARLEAAYGLLAAAQQKDPVAVRAMLTHPSVGTWAARCLAGLQSPSADPVSLATDLGRLAAFAAAAAIKTGCAFAIEVPMRDRAIFLPTLGQAVLEPGTPSAADSCIFATVSNDGRQVTITADRNVVTLPADPSLDGPGWQALRSLRACHCGMSIAIEFDDLDPDQGTSGMPLAGRQTADEVAAWQSMLDGAWATLARHHRRRASGLVTGLRSLTPLKPADKIGMSVTDAASFGGHALTPPRDPLSLADTLVHEFGHSVLSATADLGPLHTAGPDAVHYSPWRNDPRPIEGLLQGAYAYLGVTRFWEVQRNLVTDREQALANYEFARWRLQIPATARKLLESGTLTQAGATLVHGMAATAERLRDLPVAEEPRLLAERAVADHWVRWRLRNRHPAQASVNAIATAWQDGQPCPERIDEVPVVVRPWQRALALGLGLGERSRLFHLRLADPDSFRELCADPSSPGKAGMTASASDLAYAADDFERAALGYRADLQARPDGIDSWSGLLLATAELPGRAPGALVIPEILRCVYLAVLESSSVAPDLDKLQDWMEDTPTR